MLELRLMIGDEAALYEAHSRRLERIVQRDVRAPRPVIEDACQHAWAKFIQHSDTIDRRTVIPWLTTTAVRRAYKLNSRENRERSLELEIEHNHEPADPTRHADPAEAAEWRAELARLDALPERQQRLIWLQALGLTYAEIAARSGDSERTVERQLLRARRTLQTTRRHEAETTQLRPPNQHRGRPPAIETAPYPLDQRQPVVKL